MEPIVVICIVFFGALLAILCIATAICSAMGRKEQKLKNSGYYCELCQSNKATEKKFGIDLCEECSKGYSAIFRGDKDALEKYSDFERFPNASQKAVREIISLASSKIAAQEPSTNETDISDEQHSDATTNPNTKIHTQTANTIDIKEEDSMLPKILEEIRMMRKENAQTREDIHQIHKDVHFFKIVLVIWIILFGGSFLLSLSNILSSSMY